MATTISCSSRRATNPSLLSRIVYHVGRPWMLEGKRFLPETGIPILNKARKMVVLAVELPDPLTVPTVIEKSFTTLSGMVLLWLAYVQLESWKDTKCQQTNSTAPLRQ